MNRTEPFAFVRELATRWDLIAAVVVFGLLVFALEASHGLLEPLSKLNAEPLSLDPANLPFYAARSDAVITTFPDRVGPLPKKRPTQYLKDGQLYFDTIMFTGEAMRHLITESGVGQVILGTDYPFPWNKVPVDHILSIPGLSDDDRIAILGGTAAKLLGID